MALGRFNRTTLRNVAEAIAPHGTRLDNVAAAMEIAIGKLSKGRRAETVQLLALLALPMRLPVARRRAVLRAMADSPVAKLRTGFSLLKRLSLNFAFGECDDDGTGNPFWERIGYPGARSDRDGSGPDLPLSTGVAGRAVKADVVVIGSGAGGGVAAGVFARAGKRVVVLEAGRAFNAQDITQRELSMSDLYLDNGMTSSDDLGIAVLAGATLGGGTKINWCTSFRLEPDIAAEWEAETGIAGLADELTPHFAALEHELQTTPITKHYPKDQVIVDGCTALGIQAGAMPRNAPVDCGDGCGYCGFGCAYGKKRSTDVMFLPDVITNGGEIYACAKALQIRTAGSRASGVDVEQTLASGEVVRFTVDAEIIVCSAGTLRTPGLLARSGISHPVLGKRLFLHPVLSVTAEFEHPIDAWNGPMQSAYSNAYSRRVGNYGATIESAPAHPGLSYLAMPWTDSDATLARLGRTRYLGTLIALTRDRDPGSIDLDEEAQIRYRVSPFDTESLIAGLLGCFDIAFAAGALRVQSMHNATIAVERADWSEGRKAMLREHLRAIGTESNRAIIFTAHQMGTAPMGADPRTSVVDPAGRVWGYENLLVADGSVFPQASGVNPMLTIMAMARRIASQHVPVAALTVHASTADIEPLALLEDGESLAAPAAYPTA